MSAAVETMAYAGATPWHGLGKHVPADLTTEDMIRAAGLDWTVSLKDMYFADGEGYGALPQHRALVRDSDKKVLSIVGEKWQPIQNHQVFDFLSEFVEAGQMTLETAGSLKGGQNVWALANLNDGFTLSSGDEIKGYLLISHPHEWGRALKIFFTPVRVVCNNTLTYALQSVNQEAGYFKFSHSREFDNGVVALAKETLGLAGSQMQAFETTSQLLSEVPYKQGQLVDYLTKIFPTRGKKEGKLGQVGEQVLTLVESQPGADLHPKTWWNAANAATFYVDHVAGRERDSALQNAWFGPRAQVKRNAMNLAIRYAEAA